MAETGSTSGLLAAAAERSVRKRRLVEETIGEMRRNGETVTFKTVAEKATVSRQYLYTHFKEAIENLRTSDLRQTVTVDGKEARVRSSGRATTIEMALRNKIARLEEEMTELRKANTTINRRYEKALGEAEEWRTRHKDAVAELLEVKSRLKRYE